MTLNNFRIDEQNKRIEYFNEHWYPIEGFEKPFVSVSKVLNDVLAKGEEFDNFLKMSGFDGEEVGRKAMESGSKLHKAFELAILGNEINAVNVLMGDSAFTRKEWEKYLNWSAWYENLKPVPLAIEKIVYSPTWQVAGTADFVGFIGGDLWLLDWKTGNNIYDSSELQIAAYKRMYNEVANLTGEPLITRAGVVHIGAKNKLTKDMNGKGVSVKEITEVEERIFDRLVEIWHWRNPDPSIPSYSYPMTSKLTTGILSFKEETK